MNRLAFTWVLCLYSALGIRHSAFAQVPSLINYQGRLVQGTNLVNGVVSLRFRFYTNSLAGAHHFESTNQATVADGLYATAIGQFVVLGSLDDALTRPENWLEVAVNGVALAPRERVLAVPYARQTHGLRITAQNSVVLNPVAGLNSAAVNAQHASIGGGLQNSVQGNADYSVIGGGDLNVVQGNADAAVIAGGQQNTIQSNALFAAIGGGIQNGIQDGAAHAVIGGGDRNTVGTNAVYSVIGGGRQNAILPGASNAVVAGGALNLIQSGAGAIGGGQNNAILANAPGASVGGGMDNSIQTNADYAVVGGGQQNTVQRDAQWATIGGGVLNRIGTNAPYATIPGGYLNQVGNDAVNAFAAGRQAVANHQGAFVWADNNVSDFASTADNQFSVRATGGVRWSDDTPAMSFGTTTRQMIHLWGSNYGIGVQNFAQYYRTDGEFHWFKGGQHNNEVGNSGGGTTLMSLTAAGLTVNGTFVSSSDRAAKENFAPVDARTVLERVAALPIAGWNYKDSPGIRHIGPVAQDFHAAFGVGPDDRHITMVDADGVALAAIQALAKENAELKAKTEALEARLRALEAR